jgi:hypothetical protein
MSTRSPRNGTPSASSSARWSGAFGERAVGADDPEPRQRRVAVAASTGAGEARRARGDVAVGAHEALGVSRHALEHRAGASGVEPHATIIGACATGPTPSSRATRRPASSARRVQSHWFSVGSLCAWARPGSGAVATQSVVEPAHGPDALDRLAAGDRAGEALGELLAATSSPASRQVGVVDADGGVAVHTGAGLHRRGRPRDRRHTAARRT